MKRTELTLLIAMDKSVARPLAGFVEVVCAKMPCPGVCIRLVGFGENEKTLSPLVSVQPYVETAAELRHQAVELSRTPFSGGRVSPAIGLRGAFAGLEKSRASDRIVLIVADRRDSRAKTVDGDALADELRKSGVLIRWISIDNPNAVVCVLKERGGGYVRAVERRERMTILARYSCQYGAREREFSDCILSQLRAFKSELNVERFTLPVEEGGWGWSIGRVYDLYHDVLWNNPQIFYVNKYAVIRWRRNANGGARMTRITDFTYAIGAADYARCRQELETAAREAVAGIEGCSDPVAKALHLHDYIVRTCEYDRRGKNNPLPIYRTAYDVLVRHRAVCEGYVMAYRYLLALVGIESEEVISKPMKHCWSYLHIGANWYHVDVTWDDPIRARATPGKTISHRYFLLSDAAMRGKRHHGWDVRGLPAADDTRYDRVGW